MSEITCFPGGEPVRLRPDLTHLPVRFSLPIDRRPAVTVLAAVCLWGAIGTVFTFRQLSPLTELRSEAAMGLAYALGFLISAAIFYLGWRALRLYVAEQEIEIDAEAVRYSGRRLFSSPRWREPLRSYQGIRHRTIAAEGDRLPWQIIEIVHTRPGRTLPLFAERGAHLPGHLLRDAAHRLCLPVIDEGD